MWSSIRSNYLPVPRSISGQMTFFLFLATLLPFTILLLQFGILGSNTPPKAVTFTNRVIAEAEILDRVAPWTRQELIDTLPSSASLNRKIITKLPDDISWHDADINLFITFRAIEDTNLKFAMHVSSLGSDDRVITSYVRLSDGSIMMAEDRFANRKLLLLFLWPSLFLVITSTVLLIWARRELVWPLQYLSNMAGKFTLEGRQLEQVKQGGPLEVRNVARALNFMQQRIHALVEDRMQMLAAVGHDLRTSVTRMRMRIETLENEKVKQPLTGDISQMQRQLEHLLYYFSNGDFGEESTLLDLGSIVESAAHAWTDDDYVIDLDVNKAAPIYAKSNELLRLLDNLIDNALKYAGSCTISLQQKDDRVCLRIIDHGPGIPDEKKNLFMAPFVRGNSARTMDKTSGFGLGLSIASNIALRQNIELTLSDTTGGGLTVELLFSPFNIAKDA